jgi:hypothetical protein
MATQEPLPVGASLAASLVRRVSSSAGKNAGLVQAVNSAAVFAGDSEQRMQLLVDGGLVDALRTTFLDSNFVAPRAVLAQCLCIFASRRRFRDIIGVRYGFVRHAVAWCLKIHAMIGLPALDGSARSAAQRVEGFANWAAAQDSFQHDLGTLHGSALQETLLALLVLLRLCCASVEGAAVAAQLPLLPLLLDFLELFKSSPAQRKRARYPLWEHNILGLLQGLLQHTATGAALVSSAPLLSRYLAVLDGAARMKLSVSERAICSGMLYGLWNMTSRLSVHPLLIKSGVIRTLVRYGAGAVIECVAPEAWNEYKTTTDGEAGAPPRTQSSKEVTLRSMVWCVQCLLNLSASSEGCEEVMSTVLSSPSLWELLMVSDGSAVAGGDDDLIQVALLRLFDRLYGVNLRPERVSAAAAHGDLDPLADQRSAILRQCLRSSNPEPVLFVTMRLLGRLGVPLHPHHGMSAESPTGHHQTQAHALRPLGSAELVDAVVNRGDEHVAHLFIILHSPPSTRCARAALTLTFRCVCSMARYTAAAATLGLLPSQCLSYAAPQAADGPPGLVVHVALQLVELCASLSTARPAPRCDIGIRLRTARWMQRILSDETLRVMVHRELLTPDWVPRYWL